MAISKFGDLFSSMWSTSKPGDMKNGAGAQHINDALGLSTKTPAAAPKVTTRLDDPLYDPYGDIIGGHRRMSVRDEMKHSLTAGGTSATQAEIDRRFREILEKQKAETQAAKDAAMTDMSKLRPKGDFLNIDMLRAAQARMDEMRKPAPKVNRDKPQNVDDAW